MKALAKLSSGPGLTLTDVPMPELGHNDVMIRIKKTAIIKANAGITHE